MNALPMDGEALWLEVNDMHVRSHTVPCNQIINEIS